MQFSPRIYRVVYVSMWLANVCLAGWTAWAWVDAVRDQLGPNRLVVPLAVERTAHAQVFYDAGNGIRGEDTSLAEVVGGAAVRDIRLAVPRTPLRELRFDPMPFAGRFTIGAPRLETASGRVVARFPLAAVVPRAQVVQWTRVGQVWEGATGPENGDPQLTLELGAPLRVGAPHWPWLETLGWVAVSGAVVRWRRRPERGTFGLRSAGKAVAARLGALPPGWLDCLALAGVAMVQAGQLWPLHGTMDWPLWDEANYAAAGANWWRHGGVLGQLHSAPLYMASYGLWSGLGDLGTAIFTQHYVLKIGTTVLLAGLFLRWWGSRRAAACVALAWGATWFQLEFPLLVYQGAWLWFLAGLGAIDRWPAAGVLLLALATAVRQEYQFALAVAGVWTVWRVWRGGGGWRWGLATRGRIWVGGGLAAVLAAVLAGVAMRTDLRPGHATERGWFAFQQHYAARAVAVGEVTGLNPWLDYSQVMARDFPGAHSLREAWRANPSAVIKHVTYNLTKVGHELAELATPHPKRTWWVGVLLAAGALALLGTRTKRVGGASVSGSAVVAVAALLVVGPGLVVLAKGAYLLALIPLLAGAVGCGLRRFPVRPMPALAVWAGAGVAVGGLLVAPRIFEPGSRSRAVVETVAELQAIWPREGRPVLLGVSASSFAHYLGDERCAGVEPYSEIFGVGGASLPLSELVAQTHPLAVLVTPEWRLSSRFDEAELRRVLPTGAWSVRELPAGTLYWREVR